MIFVGGDEIYEISRDEFVQLTEHERGRYLSGDGTDLRSLRDRPGNRGTRYRGGAAVSDAQEQALIRGVRRRTFVMFEEQLQQAGDPAADPTIAATAS